MSVFEQACAERASGGVICVHSRDYYASVTGEPPVFYIIGELELPEGATLKETLSDTGDECHREVENVSNKKLYKTFKNRRSFELFYTCENNTVRPVTTDDVAKWKLLYGE